VSTSRRPFSSIHTCPAYTKTDSDIDLTSLRGDKPSAARSFSILEATPGFMVKHEKEHVIQDETQLFRSELKKVVF
jgi:hypothetical protein